MYGGTLHWVSYPIPRSIYSADLIEFDFPLRLCCWHFC